MACTALLSLNHVLEHTLDHDSRYLILAEKQQLQSLLEKVCFLQDFLDSSSQESSETIEKFDSQIRDAAFKAEDIIESSICQFVKECRSYQFRGQKEEKNYQFRGQKQEKNCFCPSILRKVFRSTKSQAIETSSKSQAIETSSCSAPLQVIELSLCNSEFPKTEISLCTTELQETKPHFTTFCPELEKVIQEIDAIINKCSEKIHEDKCDVQDLPPRTWSRVPSSKPASSFKNDSVGLDDEMMVIKEQLTGGKSNLQTVSVVGMGGIGKTFLAKKVYYDQLILYHFHLCAWVTVSQNYTEREILLVLLDSMKNLDDQIHRMETDQLKEHLHKNLKGRRYLIVMDDIWDAKVWDHFWRCFPNDNNGSRILLTSRLDNVADCANSCFPPHHKRFLEADESWSLFCENVFGKDCCPLELEQIGKMIVESCRGLPLEIIVIAGFLSKTTRTQHYWTNVEENLSSIICWEDDKFSKILSLSYKFLPHHLKGCFLYMGIFPEDFKIRVSKLIKLWVAEGFIKSSKNKTLEDTAEEYLLDLVDRNLVLVGQRSSQGKIKTCMIHDLLHDMCVREAERQEFFQVDYGFAYDVKSLRHLGIPRGGGIHFLIQKQQSLPLRTLLSFDIHSRVKMVQNCPLIRVLDENYICHPPIVLKEAFNLRSLACCTNDDCIPEYVYDLRNLQTLIIHSPLEMKLNTANIYLDREIWRMTQLRHVKSWRLYIPDPPISQNEAENHVIVLENLQSLWAATNFRSRKEILKRIPFLRKLGVVFDDEYMDWGHYCLRNLVRLDKLEILKCYSLSSSRKSSSFVHNIIFPASLKKLNLHGCFNIPWEDMSVIGSLPNLLVLKLHDIAFTGPDWKPNEGEFLKLKYMLLSQVELENWEADSIHFPSLQHLVLDCCSRMKEIPCGIGEIPTLQMIEVCCCNDELVTSAKQILEEQQIFGNDVLRVLILEESLNKSRRSYKYEFGGMIWASASFSI